MILRGAHFEPDEIVLFDELTVAYTQLDAWVATSGFDRVPTPGSEQFGVDVSFREPEPISIKLADATVELGFSSSLKDPSPHRPELTIKQRSAFLVRFNQPTALEDVVEYVYQLRNFVGLGVGLPLAPTRISGFVRPREEAAVDRFSGVKPKPRKLRIDLFLPARACARSQRTPPGADAVHACRRARAVAEAPRQLVREARAATTGVRSVLRGGLQPPCLP